MRDADERFFHRLFGGDARHLSVFEKFQAGRAGQQLRDVRHELRDLIAGFRDDAVGRRRMHDDIAQFRTEDEVVLIFAHDGIVIGAAADEIGKVEVALAAVERAQAGVDDVIGRNEFECVVLRHAFSLGQREEPPFL